MPVILRFFPAHRSGQESPALALPEDHVRGTRWHVFHQRGISCDDQPLQQILLSRHPQLGWGVEGKRNGILLYKVYFRALFKEYFVEKNRNKAIRLPGIFLIHDQLQSFVTAEIPALMRVLYLHATESPSDH
jgi:hypothetical protein